MDIEGLGESTVKILQKDLKNILDVYKINDKILKKYREFTKFSGNQESFININVNYLNEIGKNLLNAIEKSKKTSFEKLIYALGIPYVGRETARLLACHFGNDKKLVAASCEEILEIDGIGSVIALEIVDFFSKNKTIFSDLKKLGVKFL
jgi:DNA ligase (NAD+)